MEEFLKKNFWNLIVTFAGIMVAWSTLKIKLDTTTTLAQENKQAIVQYSTLVERIIKLEENRNVVTSDLSEIKSDMKDLKKHFEIK
jgi:hypothetical protein